MIPGIVAGQMRVAAGGGTLWTPLNMATVPQIYLDAQDSVVTDVSGFASAISNLGAMGVSGDFVQSTEASRPAILAAELNGKRVLSFDGSNDYISSPSTNARSIFRNVAAAWMMAVYKKRTTDVSGTNRYMFYSSQGASQFARFGAQVGSTTAANAPRILASRLDGDGVGALVASAGQSEAYTMLLTSVNYSTREGRIYLDGELATSTATLTGSAGNTSNSVAQQSLTVGAFFDGSVAGDVDLAAIVISNTNPSASDIDKLFGWAAHRYGLTASLPVGHPYKSAAPTV